MKVIAFANQKGGVAKTTTCVNIAGIFASKGLKTLVVDSDPQCNATSFLLRDEVNSSATLAALYEQKIYDSPELIKPTRLMNLSVIPGGFKLAGMVSEVYSRIRNHERLAMYFGKHATNFDVIFIDCPPDIGIFTLNAFVASNYLIVPMIPERLSLEGYKQLQEKVELVQGMGLDVSILGSIITVFQGGLAVHKEWKKQIEVGFGNELLGIIHSAAEVKRVSELRELLCEGDKGNRAYKEHLATAHRISSLIGMAL
ncbi:sporulation initiation inhibitor Soj [Synergistales bacterium]|nr:sporulation initiation inhibitor Soj [Synergistales bacterium]